ncbi:protocadherin Fat 4-like isoform X4 [Acropora muricata]|uniref:protocadherin Fat 4-like isoform X4 n=1 Tax=Acropora muricata TaxID=159855 RepID=UPI0034E3CF8B
MLFKFPWLTQNICFMKLPSYKIFALVVIVLFGVGDVYGEEYAIDGWSIWSSCSHKCQVGSRSRSRTILIEGNGGALLVLRPYQQSETSSCGTINGGCEQICNPSSGQCSCRAGYIAAGKNCNDLDECTSQQPCSHTCVNTIGSFHCECPVGFYLISDGRNCDRFDCGSPDALFSSCPSDSYSDHFSSVCAYVVVTCPSGTHYNEMCYLSCPENYALSKITSQSNTQFGENYTVVDFVSVSSSIICQKTQGSHTVNVWDVADSGLSQYFCRRSNDPPSDLKLNGSSLREHSSIGTVIGTLSSKDSQGGQTFMYTVQRPASLLMAQADELVNMWDNPRLNGNVSLDSGGVLSVTIRTTDNGVPPMWLERTFHIAMIDVNDPPEQIQLSNLVVYENATIGAIVGELTAVDGDDALGTTPHSNFKWELLESDNGRFVINHNKIRVARPLGGEAGKLHKITIKCLDYGNPQQSKTESFFLNVVYINDLSSSLRLLGSTVHETAKVGTLVGQLVATEKDGDNLSFDISQSSRDTLNKFEIESIGCQGPGYERDCKVNVTVKSSLDFEEKAFYTLNVVVTDSNTHASKQFNIEVIDDNEAPTGINLTGSHSVLENAVAGSDVGQFVVIDPDNANFPSHQTHSCAFDVRQPSDEHFFVITSELVLKVKGAQQINYEQVKNLTFSVICTDSGHPPLSLSRDFYILVKDVNETPSGFCREPIVMHTGASNGTVIANLSGIDPDNEKAINRDSYDTSVVVKNKQQLSYFMGPKQSSLPFKIQGNILFKSGEISRVGNFTVRVKVEDDGVIVASFSSRGYRYVISTPQSAFFTCTIIVSEDHQSSGVRLSSNQISVTVEDGAVVGVLSTISPNPGETFSYQLLEEAEQPFGIHGNKVVVMRKKGQEFQVPFSDETFIGVSITIISIGSLGNVAKEMFVITIVDDRSNAVNICLNPHTVYKNQPADSLVGQVMIDDSSSSLLTCSKQHCCPKNGRHFNYNCNITNPEDNEALPRHQKNVSALFQLDGQFRLRTRVPMNSSIFADGNGSLEIQINCVDTKHPLHFIGQTVLVNYTDCDSGGICPDINTCPVCENNGTCQDAIDGYSCQCMMGYTGRHCETNIDECQEVECLNGGSCQDGVASFTCVCTDEFSGHRCERQQSLCTECTTDTLCVKFIDASIRCLERLDHIPVLVNEANISQKNRQEGDEHFRSSST